MWVNVVFVSGHTRGRGVGRLLYEHLEASVRAEGFRRVTLVIYAVNAASLQFHQRLGYAIETTIDWKRLPPRPVLPRKSQEKRFSVGLAQPGMLVAARADGTEVGHVLFEDTQESPYGISYGEGTIHFLVSLLIVLSFQANMITRFFTCTSWWLSESWWMAKKSDPR